MNLSDEDKKLLLFQGDRNLPINPFVLPAYDEQTINVSAAAGSVQDIPGCSSKTAKDLQIEIARLESAPLSTEIILFSRCF